MISNATPLILLSRIGRLDLLQKLFETVHIPPAVREEILVHGKAGVYLLQEAIEKGWLVVAKPAVRLDINAGAGETEAIALAKEKKDTLIIDDAYARKAAEVYQVSLMRTTTVVLMAVEKKVILKKEALQVLNRLVSEGYYIRPEEYGKLIALLSE